MPLAVVVPVALAVAAEEEESYDEEEYSEDELERQEAEHFARSLAPSLLPSEALVRSLLVGSLRLNDGLTNSSGLIA